MTFVIDFGWSVCKYDCNFFKPYFDFIDQLQIWLQQLQTIFLKYFLKVGISENNFFAKSIFENIFC